MAIKEFIRGIIVFFITLEARAVLKKYKPNIIVVTGSVGKTSTKDAAYTALKDHAFVRRSEKSFNSDIGVPLTILGVPNGWSNIAQWIRNLIDGFLLLLVTTPYPRWLIVEVGADRPGDISRALSWVRPNVVVTTHFPEVPVHVEFYDSPEAVVAEELHPLRKLKEGATAVVSVDDPKTKDIVLPPGVLKISYGMGEGADVRGGELQPVMQDGKVTGISFDVSYKGTTARVVLPGVLGNAHRDAALAGIAAALAAGAPFERAASAFERHTAPPGRLSIIGGVQGSTIIDDSYNASPAATKVALDTLKATPGGRKIAILADMLELGSYSITEHEQIGAYAAARADILLSVGVRAKGIAAGAKAAGMASDAVHTFERGAEAAAFVLNTLREGDVVLVKGSQSMRMERVVKSLMAEPDRAKDLLARQDAEWLARP